MQQPGIRGSTIRQLENHVANLEARMAEAQTELEIAKAALTAAVKAEESLPKEKRAKRHIIQPNISQSNT